MRSMARCTPLGAILLALGCHSPEAAVHAVASTAVSATDQSSDAADVETTRRIREALVQRSALSIAAQNVVIVTASGSITLTGTVPDEDEHLAVAAIARQLSGGRVVADALKVVAD